MRDVRGLGAQHQLGVRSHLDVVRAAGGIAQREASDLGIVFRGHLYLERGHDVAVAADDLGAVLSEAHLVHRRLRGAGLVARRPDAARLEIAQQDVTAGVVARRVFAPARHRQIVPAAVARAGGGEHHRVATVREQVGLRRGVVRAAQAPHLGHLQLGDARGRAHFLGARMRHGDIARRAFLQQQLRGLHVDVGMEAVAHAAVEQRVGDGDDAHALVVRHVGADQYARSVFRQAARREVHGLEEAVAAARADASECAVVGERRLDVDHGREAGGVGRHHLVLREATLEAQPGHAEIRILVGELEVARVVRRLGNSPGNLQFFAVLDLPLHHQPAGLRQQTTARRAQHQVGHEVLEHRARPRHQRRGGADRRHGATQPEPVARGHVALGDGEEACQACLGSQQVVAGRIQASVGGAVADREQLALAVHEEAEFHGARELQRHVGQALEVLDQEAGRIARQQITAPAVDGAARGLDPVHQVAAAIELGLGGQRAHQVHQRGGALGGRGQVVELRIERPRLRTQRGVEIVEGGFEQLARDGAAGRELEFAQSLARQVERIGQAHHRLGARLRVLLPFAERAGQGHQVRGEIAGVHRRDVARFQRPQVARVVPVVEMAAVLRHARQAAERGLDAIQRVAHAAPAEVARRHDGQ